MRREVEKRAVVGGACVGFVVGVVGLTLTSEMTTIGNRWVEDSVMGMFAAMGVAAASGGVVTAVLVDSNFVGTVSNIFLADLLSSLMGIAAVLLVFIKITSDVSEFLALTLFASIWLVPSALGLSVASIAVALVAGLATYGVRRWWRDSAVGHSS